MSALLVQVVIDGGAVDADGLGDLGDGVLPLPVRAGGGVHAADGGGLPCVQLGLAAAGPGSSPVPHRTDRGGPAVTGFGSGVVIVVASQVPSLARAAAAGEHAG